MDLKRFKAVFLFRLPEHGCKRFPVDNDIWSEVKFLLRHYCGAQEEKFSDSQYLAAFLRRRGYPVWCGPFVNMTAGSVLRVVTNSSRLPVDSAALNLT